MKRTSILFLVWLASSLGIFFAASQDWYAAVKPVPGIQRVVATGLESFPLLATLPWVSILCLLLIWYFGSIGKVLTAAITLILSLAGAASIAFQGVGFDTLLSKIEKLTGIQETSASIASRVEELWPKYLTFSLLLLLGVIAAIALVWFRKLPGRRKSNQINSRPDDDDLWSQQS